LDGFQRPINIVEIDYSEGSEPAFSAVGNIAITTSNERLFLREP
jgi:hypothetical protein